MAFNFTPPLMHATKINGEEQKQAPFINNASAICGLRVWVPELFAGWAETQTCSCTLAPRPAAHHVSHLTRHGGAASGLAGCRWQQSKHCPSVRSRFASQRKVKMKFSMQAEQKRKQISFRNKKKNLAVSSAHPLQH